MILFLKSKSAEIFSGRVIVSLESIKYRCNTVANEHRNWEQSPEAGFSIKDIQGNGYRPNSITLTPLKLPHKTFLMKNFKS